MKTALHRHSIQFKLTLTFLLTLLPLVGVSIFSNYYSQRNMHDQITERTYGAMLTTLEYIDELTKSMDQQTLLIGLNPNLVHVWRGMEDPLSQEHLYDVRLVQRQLSALTQVNGAVREVFIVHGKSGKGVSTSQGAINWPNVREEFWFRQTIDAGGGLEVYVPNPELESMSAYLSDQRIYYSRKLEVLDNYDEPNVVVFVVDKSSLQNIVQNLRATPNINISLFYNGDRVLGDPQQEETSDHLFLIEASNGAWSISMEQPKSELFLQLRKLQQLTYVIIGISVLLALWIAWLVYSSIARPLNRMLRAIRQFSMGNLTVAIRHRRKDEFGYLMDTFNRMAQEDNEKRMRLARSQLNLLQSQINPHFLYNTLDSIYSVAIQNNIVEISEMVINLAHFFRVSLGKGRDTFSLEETAQHLMYYVRVQQIRTDHFTVEIDLHEDTKSIQILKLVLQPIVENAIVHGLSRSGGGEVRIQSQLIESKLYIVIEDTGTGIEKQQLEDIRNELNTITSQSYLNSLDEPFSHYFGLKNVKSRIKLYHGEQADLHIESVYGEGTRVTLVLPLLKGRGA